MKYIQAWLLVAMIAIGANGEVNAKAAPVRHAENAKGNQTHYNYDVEGNLVQSTDAAGKTTLASYGAFDLLKSNTDANGNTYHYRYDPDSLKLTAVINPQGDEYRYEYDAADNVIASIWYSY